MPENKNTLLPCPCCGRAAALAKEQSAVKHRPMRLLFMNDRKPHEPYGKTAKEVYAKVAQGGKEVTSNEWDG